MKKNNPCFRCNDGIIRLIEKPHSYDYNHDGEIFLVCDNCGWTNDIKSYIDQYVIKTKFSNKFIKKVLSKLSRNGQIIDYKKFKIIKNNLINKKIYSVYDLTEIILSEAKNLDINLKNYYNIPDLIYSKYGAYLDLNSWC